MSRSVRKDGEPERYAFVSGLTTHTDDVIRVVTGNGGGLGDPKERDPEAVRRGHPQRADHARTGEGSLRLRHLTPDCKEANRD